jgi:hypothetical protein
VDKGSEESTTSPLSSVSPSSAPLSNTAERYAARGVSRRRALGAAGVGVAGALLPVAPAQAQAAAGSGTAVPGSAAAMTDAQVAVIAAVARTMASLPVMLPYRVGKDPHPLDRVTEVRIRTLTEHLPPAQTALARQGADILAAAGVGSARPPAIAATIAARTDWDGNPGVAAALSLATATATPLGFCDAFPLAWRTLLRTRSWPMITAATAATAGEAK